MKTKQAVRDVTPATALVFGAASETGTSAALGPATARISAQSAISGEGFVSDFLNLTHTVVPQLAFPLAGQLFDACDPNVADALDGAESPMAALNAVADAWKQLLAGS